MGAPHNVENPRRTSKSGMPASRQHIEPASAPAAELPWSPNSDKRRSTRRMQAYILAQGWSRSQKVTDKPKPAEPEVERSAPVESDVRMSDEPTEEADEERRGKKRTSVETMEPAPRPGAVAAAKQSPQPQQQQQKRPAVESTAKPTEAVAKQPVAATKQSQQQQKQRHAAETAAQPAAAAAKAVTTTAPAAAPGQKLKWADRGVLRPDGTVDNADWKCRGCGQPEITGFGGKGEDEVLLGCSCRHPIWHKSGRLDSKISRTTWVCSRFWKAQPPRDDHEP